MATVTTTITPAPVSAVWDNPSNIGGNQSGIPIARFLFREQFTIPAKDALDISHVILNLSLPVNFVYRLETFNITMRAAAAAAFADLDSPAIAQMAQPTGQGNGTFGWFSPLVTNINEGGQTLTNFIGLVSGSTTFFQTYGPPPGLDNVIFKTLQAVTTPSIKISWTDLSSDDTVAFSVNPYITFLQYTLDGEFSWQMNSPRLVNGV